MNEKSANKPLTSTMEDYLETIFDLEKEKKLVRVKDIAKRLDVKMPTVSSMLGTLSKRGLVNYEKREYVELTNEGTDVGREMRRRHKALFAFLTRILRINEDTADDEACKMEHVLSPSTLDRISNFMEFVQVCPRAGEDWINRFDDFRKQDNNPRSCLQNNGEEYPCKLHGIEDARQCAFRFPQDDKKG